MNWWAMIVAGVVMFVIGAVWYAPLFGKQWRALQGIPEGTPQTGLAQALVVGFIGNLVEAAVLAWFIDNAGPLNTDVVQGMIVGFWAWVGFILTVMVPSIFYERKPPMLVVINGAYQLIGLVVMGAILGWWR